jgi:hypothetical protein
MQPARHGCRCCIRIAENANITALFSNTARAHKLGKTRDWVILYHDGRDGERQFTVITSRFGPLKGKRIVRGREPECQQYYEVVARADVSNNSALTI